MQCALQPRASSRHQGSQSSHNSSQVDNDSVFRDDAVLEQDVAGYRPLLSEFPFLSQLMHDKGEDEALVEDKHRYHIIQNNTIATARLYDKPS
jgi:hypothetical protein